MFIKFIVRIITLFSIIILTIGFFLFEENSFNIYYFIGNSAVIIICMGLFLYLMLSYLYVSEKIFIKNIFWISLLLRLFSILFISYILNNISGGDIAVEEYDGVFYDYYGRILSTYYSNGYFNSDIRYFFYDLEFDDKGYIFILSLLYFLFDNLLFAKIVQGLFDTFSVILIYKIAKEMFNEQIARITGILFSVFFPIILISSLHTKEVYMIFFLLLSIYYSTKIIKRQYNIKNISLLLLALIALFSMRLLLGVIVFISIIYYLFLNQDKSYFAKIILPIIVFVLFIGTLKYIGAYEQVGEKLGGYLGYETSEKIEIGGRSVEEIEKKGQTYAKYATVLLFIPQAIITPYPSIVKTNIKMYDTSMQWFFAGGLFIWSFLSFFAFIGIYQTIKFNFKKTSLITIILGLYIIVLLASVYITSIRFNMPKLVLLLFFTAVGINYQFKNRKRNFIIYVVFISFLILGWNYIKLAGRGMI